MQLDVFYEAATQISTKHFICLIRIIYIYMVVVVVVVDIRQKYALSVKNKFQSFNELEEVEHQWENFKQAINEAAVEVIPPLKRRAKQKWMTEDILKLMDKRRQAKCNNENYEAIH